MLFFNCIIKDYVEEEVCFMFVNKGEVGICVLEDYFMLNKSIVMLVKCLNYFFEFFLNKEVCKEGIEFVGIFFYFFFVKDFFVFDVV